MDVYKNDSLFIEATCLHAYFAEINISNINRIVSPMSGAPQGASH